MTYPWQQSQWQQLMERKDSFNFSLPHALLLLGIKGVGKADFAEKFIRVQLCQSSGEDDCDCHSCRLIAGKTHPDVLWIQPEKKGAAIKIDQIREISDFINQTSLQGEYRFVLIPNAGSMNINAANALLKTLEEPASGSMLILTCEQASHLPATIVSRCQHIHFPRPKTELAMEWLRPKLSSDTPELLLRLANGGPLLALQFMEDDLLLSRTNVLRDLFALSQKKIDPLKAAANTGDIEIVYLLDIMLTVATDLLRLQLNGNDNDIINQDFLAQLNLLQQQTSPKQIISYLNFLLVLRGQQQKGFNLNKQLTIENMFIRWLECA